MTPAADAPLPDDLADEAGQQLLATTGAARRRLLASLVAAHPRHAAALHRLCRDLDCVDGVLGGAYPTPEHVDDEPPAHLGGHRVIRRLGDGAFGIVWLCAQEKPVERFVALKVLRADVAGKATLQRFAAERQVLASLNHPAITQVFDAGELPDGRPFFVMEYVDGEPLRSYCDARDLGVRERLRLFVDVCRGTAHAHARGIVHRDLKPANVLVVDTERGPIPKIIDFGIAKALFPAVAPGGSTATEAGRIVGTPGYMSPEQASGAGDAIDARTDVFALGVMLYELLTDELPWPRGAAATTADPEPPSVRVANHAPPGERTLNHQKRAAELRLDLDWITAKALARERDDRYASPADLAADLERHLRGEPVSARPPRIAYRARKFVRRNAVAVGAVSLALALAAVAWCGWLMRADDAEQRSTQATLAVERLLARASDERLRRAPQTDGVRQGLAQDALDFYELWLRDRPMDRRLRLGRCRALVQLSQVHWQLGQIAVATRTSTEAVAEARSLHDEGPEDLPVRAVLAEALRRHGRALMTSDRLGSPIPTMQEAVDHFEACFAADPRAHALPLSSALRELASAFRNAGKGRSCLAAERRSAAVLEQLVAGPRVEPQIHTDLAIARSMLVADLIAAKLLDEADAVLTAAIAGLPAVQRDRDQATLAVENASAQFARARGDASAAIAHETAAIAAAERWHVAEPGRFQPASALLDALRDLASLHGDAQQWAESDAALQRSLDVAEAIATEFPDDLPHRNSLRRLLLDSANRLYNRLRRTDLALAERWARRALEVQDELEHRGWPQRAARAQCLVLVAAIVESRGDDTDELWERVAMELITDVDLAAPEHELDFTGWIGVAASRLRRGQLDATALPIAQAARWVGDPPKHVSQATEVVWLDAGVARKRRDAGALLAAAQKLLELRDTWMGRWRAADCRLGAAEILVATDPKAAFEHREAAAGLYRRVVDELTPRVAASPNDPWFGVPCGFAGLRLAGIEAERGHTDEARKLLDTALTGLDAVEAIAHRDLWQPEVLVAARQLRAELGPGGSR